jgi:hypothetical protein
MVPIGNVLRTCLVLLPVLAITASSADAQAPAKAAFGDKLSFQSADVAYGPSDDRQAFTINFKTAFEATTDKSPVSANTFSVVIPITGQSIDANLTFQGVVNVSDGGLATLIINVNDTNTVMRYRPGINQSVVVPYRYTATNYSGELAITIVLVAARDQAHPNGSAFMHFDTIDGDLGTAKKRASQ